jgi:hypothetical protein
MIDQLIRKYINNNIQKLSESLNEADKDITVDTESGWNFVIPSSKSIRGQKANNTAKENGALTGLMVIARKRGKKETNDSKLISDVKKMFDEVVIPGRFNPATTLFVYMQVVNKPKKKVWNVWAIDKKRSGINSAVQELLKQQEKIYQRPATGTAIIDASKIDEIDKITFMSYDMANNWFTLLKKSNLTTELKLPTLIDIKQFQDVEDTSITESQIVYLQKQDVSGNIYNVYRTNNGILGGFEDEYLLYKNIKITLVGGFSGKALMSISPAGDNYLFTPLEGSMIAGYTIGNAFGEMEFDGKFTKGLPDSGTVEIRGLGKDINGTFTGRVGVMADADNLISSLYLLEGEIEYGNGLTFKGKFAPPNSKTAPKGSPLNGTLYNKQKQILGQYINGKLKTTGDLTFPYEWNSNDYGVVTVYKLYSNVYVRIPSLDAWGETTKNNFQENSFDSSVKDVFTIIQDPERVKELNKEILNIEPPVTNPKIQVTATKSNLYTWNSGSSRFKKIYANVPLKNNNYEIITTKEGKIEGTSTKKTFYEIKVSGQLVYILNTDVKKV